MFCKIHDSCEINKYIISFMDLENFKFVPVSLPQLSATWAMAMIFHYISPDIKSAAIKIYKNHFMDLDDILACLNISESTFFHALQLQVETFDFGYSRY